MSFPATLLYVQVRELQDWARRAAVTSPASFSMLHWFSPPPPRTLPLTLLVAVVSAQYNLSATKSSFNMSLECSADRERLPSRSPLSKRSCCGRLGRSRVPPPNSQVSTLCHTHCDVLLHRMLLLTLNIEGKKKSFGSFSFPFSEN